MTVTRGIASLRVQGRQEFHFPYFSSNFYIFFLILPHKFLLFVLILALQMGDLPTQEGPGYTTGSDVIIFYSGSMKTRTEI